MNKNKGILSLILTVVLIAVLGFTAFAGDIWTSVERLKKDGLIFGENIWILP